MCRILLSLGLLIGWELVIGQLLEFVSFLVLLWLQNLEKVLGLLLHMEIFMAVEIVAEVGMGMSIELHRDICLN